MKKRKTEKWDEHLVIAVLVVSTICILIMLTSFMSVTGKANEEPMTGVVKTGQVLEMLNQNVIIVEGDGTMKCDYACGKIVKYTFVSHIDGQFVENNEIRSGKYICSCISN